MATKTNLSPIVEYFAKDVDIMHMAELMEMSINNYMDLACANEQVVDKADQERLYNLRSFRNVLLKSQGIHVFEKA